MDWFESAKELLAKWKAHADQFTPRAKQVLGSAYQEAERFNHNYVGTEHILLGLIKLEQGVAAFTLKQLGLNFENVLVEVKKRVPMEPDQIIVGHIPYTPRAKRVIEAAMKEAKKLCHSNIGAEHILLGLLTEHEGVAAEVFKSFNIDMEQTREKILKDLDPNFHPRDDGQNKSS
jgi:ATP-dependent Clp protease ATP-binding subunit ClpC